MQVNRILGMKQMCLFLISTVSDVAELFFFFTLMQFTYGLNSSFYAFSARMSAAYVQEMATIT